MLTKLQKFYLLVYLVKVVEVEELAKKLEGGKRITKETVVADSRVTLLVKHAELISYSGQQIPRCRHCGHRVSFVVEVSIIHTAYRYTM